MTTSTNALSEMSRAGFDTAARLTRISMDNAERVISLQLQYAKGTLEQASAAAKAASGAKDVQELLSVRTRSAENAVEWLMNYSRSFYDVASETQSELSKLAEERMSSFQQAVTESVEQAAKASPAEAMSPSPRSSPRSPRPRRPSTASRRPRRTWRATPTRASVPAPPPRRESNRAAEEFKSPPPLSQICKEFG